MQRRYFRLQASFHEGWNEVTPKRLISCSRVISTPRHRCTRAVFRYADIRITQLLEITGFSLSIYLSCVRSLSLLWDSSNFMARSTLILIGCFETKLVSICNGSVAITSKRNTCFLSDCRAIRFKLIFLLFEFVGSLFRMLCEKWLYVYLILLDRFLINYGNNL